MENRTAPLFSIIMPVYNAAATLEAAARSVLDQGERSLELLLVDDGSADESLAIARALPRPMRACGCSPNRTAASAPRATARSRRRGGSMSASATTTTSTCPGRCTRPPRRSARPAPTSCAPGMSSGARTPPGGPCSCPTRSGEPCALDPAPDGAAYLAFLAHSGPQFVWNAWYRRAFLGDLRFDERCRSGLEDFVFNAAVYAAAPRAVYTPAPHLPPL